MKCLLCGKGSAKIAMSDWGQLTATHYKRDGTISRICIAKTVALGPTTTARRRMTYQEGIDAIYARPNWPVSFDHLREILGGYGVRLVAHYKSISEPVNREDAVVLWVALNMRRLAAIKGML